MAGKRLLDAAKLINAGTAVAKQHFVIRREQWELYTRTSGVGRAVKSQTDRVTVTASAAYELAKRFNETGPSWQQGQQRAEETVRAISKAATGKDASDTSEGVVQAAGEIFEPDDKTNRSSTISPSPTADDGTLSSLRKRELQRQAERQIPVYQADADKTVDSFVGQDTFSERSETITPGLSSLPRAKVPQRSGDVQSGDVHVTEDGMNQDVYYSAGGDGATSAEKLPEGVETDIFHSPRVSKMLGRTSKVSENPYAGRQKLPPKPLPEMLAAQNRREKEKLQSPAGATNERQSTAPTDAGDAEVQDLAASIAQETQPVDTAADQPATSAYEMRESRVPSSRFGRMWQYGGLATSMAFGAVGEGFRRIGGGASTGSLLLSEGNINRLVAKLSRMRGAALKLGQMISFQDSKVLPATINTVLQRVQDSADYMPPSQRDQVLVRSLGQDWRDLFSLFEERPFAAASIGQVHKATLASNGKDVAVKIQYPGVRNSIDSDLNNLTLLLTASRLLPKGLFLDKTIANARTELGWECDYEREAQACIRFKGLVADETDHFTVPTIYTEASGPDVLTAEFLTGTAVAKIHDLTQAERDWIGTQILRLSLRELMEWRFMQTDPNWTNFLYNRSTQKLELLDFGASRDFPDEFVEPYVSLLIAASKNDRAACKDLSIQLGYLTGRESADMLKAHIDSIMTLAEPFVEHAPEVYDFEDQTITDRVRENIGLMLRERLAPPPEETYSLHRKLSGAFLLCARLRSKVKAREMFANAQAVWDGRSQKVEMPSKATVS
nr:protein abc1 like, mitochondrial [Quercus suber]